MHNLIYEIWLIIPFTVSLSNILIINKNSIHYVLNKKFNFIT